jgi:hypothetical protein
MTVQEVKELLDAPDGASKLVLVDVRMREEQEVRRRWGGRGADQPAAAAACRACRARARVGSHRSAASKRRTLYPPGRRCRCPSSPATR